MSSRKTFVEVFDLLLILHPLVLGTLGFWSEGNSSATPRDSSGPRTWMESWVVDLRHIAALAGGEISLSAGWYLRVGVLSGVLTRDRHPH